MATILIIHGPNLNLLGSREPEIYGELNFEKKLGQLRERFSELRFDFVQSNHEGELIDRIQASGADGIILNAGGYAHTSVAIADAIASVSTPVVNVHISNIYARERERHKELIAQYCIGGIYGMGFDGYDFATQYLINQIKP